MGPHLPVSPMGLLGVEGQRTRREASGSRSGSGSGSAGSQLSPCLPASPDSFSPRKQGAIRAGPKSPHLLGQIYMQGAFVAVSQPATPHPEFQQKRALSDKPVGGPPGSTPWGWLWLQLCTCLTQSHIQFWGPQCWVGSPGTQGRGPREKRGGTG